MSRMTTLDMLVGEHHWVKTYPAGRVCAHAGCNTKLSRYNPEAVCGAHHVPDASLRFNGYHFHQCPGCGAVIRGHHEHCHDCRPPSSGGKGKARA